MHAQFFLLSLLLPRRSAKHPQVQPHLRSIPHRELHNGHSYLTHSFILRKEEALVCVACYVVLTVKHILIECADLLETRKKYFEEKSLYSLFRNMIPEVVFDFLREIGVFYKI